MFTVECAQHPPYVRAPPPTTRAPIRISKRYKHHDLLVWFINRYASDKELQKLYKDAWQKWTVINPNDMDAERKHFIHDYWERYIVVDKYMIDAWYAYKDAIENKDIPEEFTKL